LILLSFKVTHKIIAYQTFQFNHILVKLLTKILKINDRILSYLPAEKRVETAGKGQVKSMGI